MNILFIGDIFGEGGREALKGLLPELRVKHVVDCVVANGENAAAGRGITSKVANEIFGAGVALITTGNHIWFQHETEKYITSEPRLIRPANFPSDAPGVGSGIVEVHTGIKLGVINLAGRLFVDNTADCPFKAADREIEKIKDKADAILVDFHAETTSEKRAMGWHLDGRVAALVGTHTHVMTADEEILPKGTAYISDVGMTGPFDSVIGMDKGVVLKRFTTGIHQKFTVAKDDLRLNAVLIDIDERTGRSQKIQRVVERLKNY